jgi:protein-tyrosine phosphatase
VIDIHCHILSSVDDGPENIEQSLQMVKQALSEGIQAIIATPHHKNGNYENTKKDILFHTEEFNLLLEKKGIQFRVIPGQETRIYGEILGDLDAGEILTLGNQGKYLFIEFPSNHVPRYTDQLFYDMLLRGITPIIVHPERNAELIENPELLYQFVKKGALTQVTASSLVGKFGKNIQKFSLQLIDANLTHFVASDAHNISTRGFHISEALDVIEKKHSLDTLYWLIENSALLAEGKSIYKEVPKRISKRKLLGIFY